MTRPGRVDARPPIEPLPDIVGCGATAFPLRLSVPLGRGIRRPCTPPDVPKAADPRGQNLPSDGAQHRTERTPPPCTLRRQSVALLLGAVTMIILGTARGQAPTSAATAPRQAKAKRDGSGPAALPDLPENVFAGPPGVQGRTGAPDPAEAKKQEHLQKIRQLAFDRRPSAILKAWSTPRDEAIKEAENPAGQGQANPGMPIAMPRAMRRCAGGYGGEHAEHGGRAPSPASQPVPVPTRSIATSGGSSTTSPWATGRRSRHSWPGSPMRKGRPLTSS